MKQNLSSTHKEKKRSSSSFRGHCTDQNVWLLHSVQTHQHKHKASSPQKAPLFIFPYTNNAKDNTKDHKFIAMLCGSYGPKLTNLQGQCGPKATFSIITLTTVQQAKNHFIGELDQAHRLSAKEFDLISKIEYKPATVKRRGGLGVQKRVSRI